MFGRSSGFVAGARRKGAFLLKLGQVVQVCTRLHLVEAAEPAREPSWEQTLVDLFSLEDNQDLQQSDWGHLARSRVAISNQSEASARIITI